MVPELAELLLTYEPPRCSPSSIRVHRVHTIESTWDLFYLATSSLFLAALSEPQLCLLAQSIERRILAEELELVRASKKVVMGFPEVQGEMWEADGDELKEDLTFIPREPVCSSFVQPLLRRSRL